MYHIAYSIHICPEAKYENFILLFYNELSVVDSLFCCMKKTNAKHNSIQTDTKPDILKKKMYRILRFILITLFFNQRTHVMLLSWWTCLLLQYPPHLHPHSL